jgi:hypothetical protein
MLAKFVANLRHQKVLAHIRLLLAVVNQNLLLPVVLQHENIFKNVIVAQSFGENEHEVAFRMRNNLRKAFKSKWFIMHHREQNAWQGVTGKWLNYHLVAAQMFQVCHHIDCLLAKLPASCFIAKDVFYSNLRRQVDHMAEDPL